MRKIEKQIIEAIRNRSTIRLSKRDYVFYDQETNCSTYRLWYTDVAKVYWDIAWIVGEFRHGGWRTNTTKSRINAIAFEILGAFSICQHNHEWYDAHGEPWNTDRVFTVRVAR